MPRLITVVTLIGHTVVTQISQTVSYYIKR